MLTQSQYDAVSSDAHAVYVRNGGAVGFDPISLITIIMSVVKVVMDLCPKTPATSEIRGICAAPNAYQKVIVGVQVRNEMRAKFGMLGYRRHNGEAIEKTIFELGHTLPQETVSAACDQ